MSPLLQGLRAVLLWSASFAYACTFFFAANKLLRDVPPTPAVGIGRVTVDGVSKMRDYLGAGLFYILVPLLTVGFAHAGRRLHAWTLKPLHRRSPETQLAAMALLALPFLLAPFFFLTTRKELWGILLPPVLAAGCVRAAALFQTRLELRSLFAERFRPYQWLLVFEASAWLLFRYLGTGKRIAHIPTFFLEVVFVAFFLLLFWLVAFFLARSIAFLFARPLTEVFESFVIGATPLLLLPALGLTRVPAEWLMVLVYPITAITIALAIGKRVRWPADRVWGLAAYVIAPMLLFCVSYGSTAHLSQWIDLFHRGESLGPASDYLRGKVPYRDVFVLHGMLENGLLDSWLMQLFGRRAEVAIARLVIIAALTTPLLWLICIVAVESIPLALLASLLSYAVSADNQRAFPLMLVVLLMLIGVRRRSGLAIVLSGVMAGVALFYSLEMGIYSILGGLIVLPVLAWLAFYPWRWLGGFVLGAVIGTGPFLIDLAVNRAVVEFFETSFLTVPSTIDAIWSLPFPDLTRMFSDFTVRTLSDLVLSERFRFVLNPLVLGTALTFLVVQIRRRNLERLIPILLILVVFAVLTQRSAMGRADFQHQYFSAFLLPPILVVLAALAGRFLRRSWKVATTGERSLLAALVGAGLVIAATALWVPDLLDSRLDGTTGYRDRLARGGAYEARGVRTLDRIQAIRLAVSRLTRPDEVVYDFSNQPALYFFTDRPNPTRFYQVPLLSPIAHQMEAIEDLIRTRPRIVFRGSPEQFDIFDGIENDLRAPAVAAFLDDHYAFHQNVRGIELWKRVERRARPLSEYRRLFTLPRQSDLMARNRFFFPTVGSVPGAAGAVWKSDLILHNPHPVPIRLRLRYSGHDAVRGRQLVLPAGRTVEFRDFIATFFAAPRTRGSLSIEFPADRRPLARVATYDASRSGETSLDAPLFDSDAALAGSALNELTIAGARASYPVRVNLGVINVGPAPTHFRITATDAAGQIVGFPAEAILYEDQSYLMVDAGSELGVPFHDPVVVHIRLMSGKAIGYAAVINGATGTQDFIPGVPSYAP